MLTDLIFPVLDARIAMGRKNGTLTDLTVDCGMYDHECVCLCTICACVLFNALM